MFTAAFASLERYPKFMKSPALEDQGVGAMPGFRRAGYEHFAANNPALRGLFSAIPTA